MQIKAGICAREEGMARVLKGNCPERLILKDRRWKQNEGKSPSNSVS
jgi:hypothetical protein